LPFIAGAVLYLFVRSLLFSQNDHGVHHLAQFHQFVSFKMVGSLFKVFGFYIKKLFIPIPLNFAITTIGSQYLWIGIGSFFIALFLLTKKLVSPTFLFIALYLITPAAIIAIANVAWTPIAERYLYLSSTFWAIWLSCLVYWLFAFGRKTQVATFAVVAFVLCSFTIFTSIRNLQWQDNVELYKDTFLQNPNFTAINNEYAIALIDSGKYSEAETILTEGINNQDNKNELLYINLARLKVKQEKFDEARQLLITSFSDKEHAHPEVLKMIADVDEKRLFVGRYNDEEERRKIIHELIDTYSVVYKMQNNPFFLYRSGQLALSVGLWVEARAAFARAYEEAPAEAYYKKAAGKLALKLEQQ
jgi:tetratricopeptide (TPR) repeat protein